MMKSIAVVPRRLLVVLLAGDIVAWVLWVVAGLRTHQMSADWLQNVARIVAPFLIGWFAAAPFTRAYDLRSLQRPALFLGRSASCWLLALGIGLLLRATVFGDGFVPIFAAVTAAVTGLLVIGWRAAFSWLGRRAG